MVTWSCRGTRLCGRLLLFGNGHTMMLEKNNKQIMHRMIAWLEGTVFKPK
jgi:hypothetical protein